MQYYHKPVLNIICIEIHLSYQLTEVNTILIILKY